MSRPIRYTYAPTALDRDGIAASQTPTGAGNLTINGALASGGAVTFTYPQFATVYSGSNIAARVFTFTGTDDQGRAATLTITGVNNSTVASTKALSGVTVVAVDAATGAAVEVGVNGLGNTPALPLDFNRTAISTSVAVKILNSSTPTYTVQHTFDDVYSSTFDSSTAVWYNHDDTALVAATANANSNYLAPPTAARLQLTAAGSLTLTLIQQGI